MQRLRSWTVRAGSNPVRLIQPRKLRPVFGPAAQLFGNRTRTDCRQMLRAGIRRNAIPRMLRERQQPIRHLRSANFLCDAQFPASQYRYGPTECLRLPDYCPPPAPCRPSCIARQAGAAGAVHAAVGPTSLKAYPKPYCRRRRQPAGLIRSGRKAKLRILAECARCQSERPCSLSQSPSQS